ncbi:glycoside hydrolase domain-containing protein [Niabella insulamsoli]|uniref:glycoside hydrolase domain-containing protein n=1 Tax=Niabella insulamsoli TaxID=3144874 RepID=UPI0031FD94A8
MRYGFIVVLFLHSLASAQSVNYAHGNESWNADSLGNHRFIVHLGAQEYQKNKNVAQVIIPWRRRDEHPEAKKIIIVGKDAPQPVSNFKIIAASNESGNILFQPSAGPGDYYVYYMPYKNEGRSNYPKGTYLKATEPAAASWLKSTMENRSYAKANAVRYESIDAFNSFYPMEIIATRSEVEKLRQSAAKRDFLVFPEDRMHPVKMNYYLPMRWAQRGASNQFSDTTSRGENFSFQLGIYALKDLENLKLYFSDLKAKDGKRISAKSISCLNTTGIDYRGDSMTKKISVGAGFIQSLWCLVDVPKSALPGSYTGNVKIAAAGRVPQIVQLRLEITSDIAKEGGIDHPERQTRLAWLNSTLAQDNAVLAPYTPLKIENNAVSLLGRQVVVDKSGFPSQIKTYFTPEMTSIGTKENNLLTERMHFHINSSAGDKNPAWKSEGVHFLEQDAGTVKWTALNKSEGLDMYVDASLEFDGFLSYTVKLVATTDLDLDQVNFHMPVAPGFAKYFMGLGLKGGERPDSIAWNWDVAHKNQDGGWIGDVNGGFQFSLRDEKYVRPLNTNFYLQKPLLLPASWGSGGIHIFKKGSAVLIDAYSHPGQMKKGDTLFYNFNLLITPFHPINTDFQWRNRFYHRYENLDSIRSKGANVVNIHHATKINPYINYPFIKWREMKQYIDSAHNLGLKVKIYNTIRELSNKAYETFPLRSLGHEIYTPGPGGGFSWLQEHIGKDYIAAWFVPSIKDAAIVNSGMSRWHNYYVEGMNWLVKNVGIDGIYLDDVAFDRTTMKRVKRVLTANGKPGIIDLHSANQFNKSDGFNNSANLYMEHFPYINRLWFGEYFDYEQNGPDFFLTEVSGIPFGLMGEMLQDGGNAWRGMLYGMTNRLPWSDGADPRPIWRFWDEFGIEGAEMLGYWSPACPVQTDHPEVLATVYKKNGKTLVAMASWANEDINVKLLIDWTALGIDPSKATIEAKAIKDFQEAKLFDRDEAIPVKQNKGWLLIIQ